MEDQSTREFLRALFREAVRSVSADACMPAQFDQAPSGGRTLIIAVGKAAAAMAATATPKIEGDCTGLVVTRAGHGGPPHELPPGFELIEAGHPVPDGASETAARRAMTLAEALGERDQLLMLVSGGGSALLSLPAPGVALRDKQLVTKSLLRSGAAISEINCVRKHLSAIKGGRLAVAAAPARVTTLVISDVPGDDPSLVASGPTVVDPTTLSNARDIVLRYGIDCPRAVTAALSDPRNETPPADAPGLAGAKVQLIARAADALLAAKKIAERSEYRVVDLGGDLEGEARSLGSRHAVLARRVAGSGEACVILSGGETTVTVTGLGGRGGRNLEYLLSLAIRLDGASGISAIACDTDGIDGTEDAAGAIVTPDTLVRARSQGLAAEDYLRANDAYSFFQALGDLVITGPTRTNVNDFRAIVVEPGEHRSRAAAPHNDG